MPTSNAEELRLFLKCTVIGRGVFGPCACCRNRNLMIIFNITTEIVASSMNLAKFSKAKRGAGKIET